MSATKPITRRSLRWKMFINTMIVVFGALLSRLLGFGRLAVITAQFGVDSSEYNTYVAAFRVPDFLYIVISGGALATTLIPVFQQVRLEEGERRAWEVVSAVVNVVLVVLACASLLIVVLAGPLSELLFVKEAPAQQQLLANMMRLFLLSSPLLLGLGGIGMAVLNARERFGWSAAAFNLYNIAIIGGALVWSERFGIWGVAYGVVLGALLYALIMLPGLAAERAVYVPRLGLRDPAVRRIGRQLLPRLVGQAAVQINVLLTAAFAARLPENQLGALDAANTLMLLPHGVFVLSLVTVMYPRLSEQWATKSRNDFSVLAFRTLRLIIFVTVPLAVGLAMLRVPIIRLLFERNRFTAGNTAIVADILLVFMTALVAFAASELLVRSFYAMQDTRTPVYVALGTIALNIALNVFVVYATDWGTRGLALAFSVANNLEAVVLYLLLRRRLKQGDPGGLRRSLVGIALSATLMGAGVWAALQVSLQSLPMLALTGAYGQGTDALRLLGWLVIVGVVGGGLYLGTALALRVPDVAELWALVRRRGVRQG